MDNDRLSMLMQDPASGVAWRTHASSCSLKQQIISMRLWPKIDILCREVCGEVHMQTS